MISEETRTKQSKARLKWIKENPEKYEAQQKLIGKPWLGRSHSEESKKKMALKKKLWWKNNPEKVMKCRERIKANHKKPGLGKKGPLSPNWKGGRKKCKRDGYIRVYAPDHPNAVNSGGGKGTRAPYILEHRLVMEKILGRYLRKDENVNHINGIKDDNRPENLRVVSHYAHFEEHGCPKCSFRFFTK